MIPSRTQTESDVSERVAASGLLVAGVAAFAIGKLVRDRQADSDREWREINVHYNEG